MAEPRILVVRLGSLGDIVHTLPAVAALRRAHPGARLEWIVEAKWAPLLLGNPDVDEVIRFDRAGLAGWRRAAARLRAGRYSLAVDFQGLYKSALLARLSGARERIGFARGHAREAGAAMFYTHRVAPQAARHVVERNLALAAAAGAAPGEVNFPLRVAPEAESWLEAQLAANRIRDYFVLSPGGGWRSKLWPAERYGHLHRRLASDPRGGGWRGVVNFGPGERALAEAARLVAGEPQPLVVPLELPQLVALLARARLVVSADTGPLHLAAALGTPVVGLYGPTSPERNGPWGQQEFAVRNARAEETTYKRGREHSPAMLSITVDQVVEAVARRLEWPR